jgi:DNA-binding PadR family transcriptional regulator
MDEIEDFRAKLRKELRTGLISVLLMDVIEQAADEGYGYAIIKRLEEYSDGFFVFKEGTIYPILHSLLRQGLVATEWRESPSGPARKCYCLTPLGRKALKAGLEEWGQLSGMAQKLLSRKGEGK